MPRPLPACLLLGALALSGCTPERAPGACTGSREILTPDDLDAFVAERCTRLEGSLRIATAAAQGPSLQLHGLQQAEALYVFGTEGGPDELVLGSLQRVGALDADAPGLTLAAPVLTHAGSVDLHLGGVALDVLVQVDDLQLVSPGAHVSLPALRQATSLFARVRRLDLPLLEELTSLQLERVRRVQAPVLASVEHLRASESPPTPPGPPRPGTEPLLFPALTRVTTIRTFELDAGLAAPALEQVDELTGGPFHAPSLHTAVTADLHGPGDLARDLAALSQVDTLEIHDADRVELPSLQTVGTRLVIHDAGRVTLPELAQAPHVEVFASTGVAMPSLPTAERLLLVALAPDEPEPPFDLGALTSVGVLELATLFDPTALELPVLTSADRIEIHHEGDILLSELVSVGSVSVLTQSGALAMPVLSGELELDVKGGTALLVGAGARPTSVSLDGLAGPVVLPGAQTMDLLSLTDVHTPSLAFPGVLHAETVILRDLPDTQTLSFPDLGSTHLLRVHQAPALTTIDLPVLDQVGWCVDVVGLGLDPTALLELQGATVAAGGAFVADGMPCP